MRCLSLTRWLSPRLVSRTKYGSSRFFSSDPPTDKQDGVVAEKEDPVTAEKDPDEPTTCCMSGCANCVWIEYAEVMAARYKDGGLRARQAIANIKDPMMKAFLTMELKSLEAKE